jgi:hypothetical protein
MVSKLEVTLKGSCRDPLVEQIARLLV